MVFASCMLLCPSSRKWVAGIKDPVIGQMGQPLCHGTSPAPDSLNQPGCCEHDVLVPRQKRQEVKLRERACSSPKMNRAKNQKHTEGAALI